MSKIDNLIREVENTAKSKRLMELHYDIEIIPDNEPYFTTSQQQDIIDMILEGMTLDQIIDTIKQW